MAKNLRTYAKAGVNRELRAKAKRVLARFESTFRFSKYGKIIKTPFNFLYPVEQLRLSRRRRDNFAKGESKLSYGVYPVSKNVYQVKISDSVGTKVLLADLAKKHDTIGIDAVAMVVNDCIRSGARPIALTDTILIKRSEPKLLKEIQKGLIFGAKEAECPIVGGEIADVPELLKGNYELICDCIGEVKKEKIITGKKIKPGNVVIGFQSSGVHSNGLTLVRKVLFKKWGGRYDAFFRPKGFKKPLIFECLEPTKIYVKPFLKIAEKFEILGAVHITGDAYLKFNALRESAGFEFFNFKPQPIFKLIQETGEISDEEMFKTFNMGWGFALIVEKKDSDKILTLAKKLKLGAEIIGKVIKERKIIINYQNKKIIL
jgi:phosphoribosylformylglycinamidine cyclo-ligase